MYELAKVKIFQCHESQVLEISENFIAKKWKFAQLEVNPIINNSMDTLCQMTIKKWLRNLHLNKSKTELQQQPAKQVKHPWEIQDKSFGTIVLANYCTGNTKYSVRKYCKFSHQERSGGYETLHEIYSGFVHIIYDYNKTMQTCILANWLHTGMVKKMNG